MKLDTPCFCSICGASEGDEEIVMQGLFGILPVAFCCWCYSSLMDMARTLWFEDWKAMEEE